MTRRRFAFSLLTLVFMSKRTWAKSSSLSVQLLVRGRFESEKDYRVQMGKRHGSQLAQNYERFLNDLTHQGQLLKRKFKITSQLAECTLSFRDLDSYKNWISKKDREFKDIFRDKRIFVTKPS